jgi:Fe-S-cluster containining protein
MYLPGMEPIRRARRPRPLPVISGRELDAADARLLESLAATSAEAARRAGPRLVCRPGCAECCVGPFPITSLDARRLRLGLAELGRRDPERASRVRDRARAAAAALADRFPGDPASGSLDDDEPALDEFLLRHQALPCPALDPATFRCDLYDARPVTCRTYGPPVRFGEERAAPCRLCFQGAPPEEVERCRVEPDPRRIEDALLAALARSGVEGGETLVAFALALDGGASGGGGEAA